MRIDVSPSSKGKKESAAVTAGFLLVVIVALYVGQGIFVPLVLAVLIAFALTPVVSGLRKLRIPNAPATLLAVVGAGILIALLGYLVVTQLLKLATDLPQYQSTIVEKIRSFQQSSGSGDTFERLASAAEQLGQQIGLGTATPGDGQPLPVINVPPSPFDGIQGLLGSMLGPLATGAIVVVLLIFLLLDREDLRDRFLRLVSRGDLRTSTKVINESASRVSRYLFVQFLVNSAYGVVFGIGLMLLGVPNAILWGLFATLFRYIPFVGTLIAVMFPLVVAFAVDPGWTMLPGVIVLYLVIELTTTNAIEPRLYGSSTGLSPLAVLIAAIFWATLWGPVGLLLATPLTVCLVVVGRYVPRLAFLEVLLGSDPVLSREQRFYQRLLARNSEEAIDMIGEDKSSDPVQFFDEVALPALRLAEADLTADGSDLGPRRAVVETLSDILNEYSTLSEGKENQHSGQILAIGGKTELDSGSAEILVSLLEAGGRAATLLPPISARKEGLGQIDLGEASVVCLCYLGTNPKSYVRYAARRLKARKTNIRILACLFNVADSDIDFTPLDLGVDAIARNMTTALSEVVALTDDRHPGMASSAIDPQLEVLRKLQHNSRHGGLLDEFLAEIATSLGVPLATATIAERKSEAKGAGGSSAGDWKANDLAEEIARTGKPLVIGDVPSHDLYRDNPFLLENGIRFYAGVPLPSQDGIALGSLSVVDVRPRTFSAAELAQLETYASEFMDRVSRSAA